MNHRIGRVIFGMAVGLLVAVLSYRWIADPAPRAERQLQESVVLQSRRLLTATLAIGSLELVDPLQRQRKVGKTYIYRDGDGWEVSGYYRRNANDRWHPYLMQLDQGLAVSHLKVQDPDLLDRAAADEILEAMP